MNMIRRYVGYKNHSQRFYYLTEEYGVYLFLLLTYIFTSYHEISMRKNFGPLKAQWHDGVRPTRSMMAPDPRSLAHSIESYVLQHLYVIIRIYSCINQLRNRFQYKYPALKRLESKIEISNWIQPKSDKIFQKTNLNSL